MRRSLVSTTVAFNSPARLVWALLLARIYQIVPLQCPHCGAQMRLVAFITEPPSVKALLTHLGEPTSPPEVAPAHGPPAWHETPESLGCPEAPLRSLLRLLRPPQTHPTPCLESSREA